MTRSRNQRNPKRGSKPKRGTSRKRRARKRRTKMEANFRELEARFDALKREASTTATSPPSRRTGQKGPNDEARIVKWKAHGGKTCHRCKRSPKEGDVYINCDICSLWFHLACVGLNQRAELAENFMCLDCQSDGLTDNPAAGEGWYLEPQQQQKQRRARPLSAVDQARQAQAARQQRLREQQPEPEPEPKTSKKNKKKSRKKTEQDKYGGRDPIGDECMYVYADKPGFRNRRKRSAASCASKDGCVWGFNLKWQRPITGARARCYKAPPPSIS